MQSPFIFLRADADSVCLDDVDAFRVDQTRGLRAKTRGSNLFSRQNWEDLDKDILMEDVENRNPQPNHRISPFLAKMVSPIASTPRRISASSYTPNHGSLKEKCGFDVQSVLNEHIKPIHKSSFEEKEDDARSSDAGAKDIHILGTPVEPSARYMVDRLSDKAAYIDHRISHVECEVEETCPEGIVQSLSVAVQQPSCFVGRVCCDTDDGRLNAQSVLLEGSTGRSNGARVRIDLTNVPEYRLFPGQVSMVTGTNPSGFCIAATSVEAPQPLPQEPSKNAAIKGMSCIIASGPFTVAGNLDYETFSALLEYATRERPDMLMLVGPFVDSEHSLIRNGECDETFSSIFDTRILSQLAAFSENVGNRTRIILMPSSRDVHHDCVFPQGPFPPVAGLPSSVTAVGNPSTFAHDGVVIACSAEDWLMAVTKEEISKAPHPPDRLPTLASHIISQRHYFPMFPPPHGIPLDSSRAYALDLPCTPHVLVTTSDLVPFAKIHNTEISRREEVSTDDPSKEGDTHLSPISVVCVNPGRLTKGSNCGTFAHIHIEPAKETVSKISTLDQRCRVEIRKL